MKSLIQYFVSKTWRIALYSLSAIPWDKLIISTVLSSNVHWYFKFTEPTYVLHNSCLTLFKEENISANSYKTSGNKLSEAIALGWNLIQGNKLIHGKINLKGISITTNLAFRLKMRARITLTLKIKYRSWQKTQSKNTCAFW